VRDALGEFPPEIFGEDRIVFADDDVEWLCAGSQRNALVVCEQSVEVLHEGLAGERNSSRKVFHDRHRTRPMQEARAELIKEHRASDFFEREVRLELGDLNSVESSRVFRERVSPEGFLNDAVRARACALVGQMIGMPLRDRRDVVRAMRVLLHDAGPSKPRAVP
jgi:hypothetical protein